MKRYFYILILLSVHWGNSFSQQKNNEQTKKLDSLRLLLKKESNETSKLNLRFKIGELSENLGINFWDSLYNEANRLEAIKIKGKVLVNMGFIYKNRGDAVKGLEYYIQALTIFEQLGDTAGIGTSFNNIATVHHSQGDSDKAKEFFEKSLKILTPYSNKIEMLFPLNNLGAIYFGKREFKKAKDCYEGSLKIRTEIGDKNGIATSLNNIGDVYDAEGDLDRALEYYFNSLKIMEEIDYKRGLAFSYENIAAVYLKKRKLPLALQYCNKSMDVSLKIKQPAHIKNASSTLRKIYLEMNDYKNAFKYYEIYNAMRDTINNEKTRKASLKRQMQYDYEKQEAVAKAEHKSELEKQQAVADEKSRKQKIVIFSVAIGLLLVIVFAGYVFTTLRATRKQKILIEHKNKEIEEKQKEILDSIRYAKRIQTALIPSEKYIDKSLTKLQKKTSN